MAEQVILAVQLVPRYHTIGRCNNYVVLQSIPCSPECKDVETLENPFVTPVNIWTIEAFMNKVGYQGVVDKKFLNIPQRIDEDYHSIKDDILLVSVYTTGNVLVREMLILDEFLTEEIRATDDFKEYEMIFMNVVVSMNQPQLSASPQGKKRKQTARESSSLRKSHKITIRKKKQSTTSIPPPATEAQEIIAKLQEKLDEEEIKKMVEVVKEKDNDEGALGSMEFRNEKMSTPTRSPRKDLSSDKTISEELTATVSPTTATTSKDSSTSKRNKRPISYKMKILPGSITGMSRRRGQIRSYIKSKFITHEFFMSKIREVLDHYNNVVPELTFAKTNEIINKEIPRLFNLEVNKDHEVDPINAQEMISKEFATHAPKIIEELF
nr:hypothetical protein [Tanacetum cinerariifolium]